MSNSIDPQQQSNQNPIAQVIPIARSLLDLKEAPPLPTEPKPGTEAHDTWAGGGIFALDARVRRIERIVYVAVVIGALQLALSAYGQFRGQPQPTPQPVTQPVPATP